MVEKPEILAFYADQSFRKLKDLILANAKQKGKELEIVNEFDVLNNLEYLCKIGTGENLNLDGNKVKYLPLPIKKLVFKMLYPNGRWSVSEAIPTQYGEALGFNVTATIYDGTEVLAEQTTFFAYPCIKEIEIEVEKKNENSEYVKTKELRYYQYPFLPINPDKDKTSCFVNAVAGLQGRCLTRAFANLGIGMCEFESEVDTNVPSTDGTYSEKVKEVASTPLTSFTNTFEEDI